MMKTRTAWTCHCGSHSQKTYDEEVDPDWNKQELLENTVAGERAQDHADRQSGDRCIPIVHYEDEENPFVREDHEVQVIHGTLKDWDYDEDARTGTCTIRALDGTRITCELPKFSQCCWAIRKLATEGDYYWAKENIGDSDAILDRCSKAQVFRVIMDRDTPKLFAVTSRHYEALDITDVADAVNEALPDATVAIQREPSGTHGGRMVADLGKYGPIQLGIRVDTGPKNGHESAKSQGVGKVLFCDNQLTLEVQNLVEEVPFQQLEKLSGSKRHVGGTIKELVERVSEIGDVIENVEGLLKTSKGIDVDEDDATKILNYYVEVGRISNRTKNLVVENLDEDDITQEPGTLYGLSMAATYLGTHETDLSDGVKEALQVIGGELLLVSEHFDEFQELVEENQPEEVEVEA